MGIPFEVKLREEGLDLSRRQLATIQVNVGKFCNQACHHCHVDASPRRTEKMTAVTAERVVSLLRFSSAGTLDITGGAPELNESFRYLVGEARAMGRQVIDRCNLTVLLQDGQQDTARFLRDQGVQIVASLPCYSKANVDKQRGPGVFEKSITALEQLNTLGYGKPGSGLLLNLVYNPLGAFLPPNQATLETSYRRELGALGIEFNQLYTLANLPIERFLDQLRTEGKAEAYSDLLFESFNRGAAEEVMCRDLVSVSWDGKLYDCDFNQMLDLPVPGAARTIWQIESFDELTTDIQFGSHCYGCTAGAGSSCGGALVTGRVGNA